MYSSDEDSQSLQVKGAEPENILEQEEAMSASSLQHYQVELLRRKKTTRCSGTSSMEYAAVNTGTRIERLGSLFWWAYTIL